MSDVRKALEAATDAAMNARVQLDAGWDEIARAAVLAFLRAMPNWESVTGPATDPIETPKYYRMALLIDDIEEEVQG